MHLVWDWNGTLLDDFHVVVEATNASFVKAGGRAITADDHRRRFRRPIIDFYAESLGRPLDLDEYLRLDEIFHESYRNRLDTMQLARDAREAMAAWTGTQSLLSMWFHHELVPMVDRFGLSFTQVDGLRDRAEGVYKTGHLERHISELGLTADRVVLIGDSVDDAHAAAAVGARCVLYSGGFTHEDNLRGTGMPVEETLVGAVRRALYAF